MPYGLLDRGLLIRNYRLTLFLCRQGFAQKPCEISNRASKMPPARCRNGDSPVTPTTDQLRPYSFKLPLALACARILRDAQCQT